MHTSPTFTASNLEPAANLRSVHRSGQHNMHPPPRVATLTATQCFHLGVRSACRWCCHRIPSVYQVSRSWAFPFRRCGWFFGHSVKRPHDLDL